MDTFVQKVNVKKLPHNSTPAVELIDALQEFITQPVSVVDGHVFLNLME